MNTNDEINQSNEMAKAAIPLVVPKKPPLPMVALMVLITGIIIANVFFLNKGNKDEKTSAMETYSLNSMNPISHDERKEVVNEPSATTFNQDSLKLKLEEAKAKDFVDRLQAGQSIETGGMRGQSSYTGTQGAGVGGNHQASSMAIPTDPNTAFMQQIGNAQPERAYAAPFSPPLYLIGQGKFIFATLAVAINSDLAGQVSAIVSQDVYAEQGRHVLIPRGSRLVGEYRSGLMSNQNRLFVVWTRVIQPNGISVMIGSEGTDALGQAGLTGDVNYHFFARFGTATLISLIGAGASTVGVKPEDQYNSTAAYRQAVAQSMAQQSSSMLSQSANIPPTIHVKQGEKIVVFVNKDLDFSRVYH